MLLMLEKIRKGRSRSVREPGVEGCQMICGLTMDKMVPEVGGE